MRDSTYGREAGTMSEDRLRELEKFVRQIATLTKTGETADGKGYEMANADAFETLHSLISQARTLMGESTDRKSAEAAV